MTVTTTATTTATHRRRPQHPLAKQHFNHIVRRTSRKKAEMYPLLGVTWNLRSKTFFPLGRVSMMVMSSHPDAAARNGEVIELLCVCAQFDPNTGEIHYSDVRMSHDFKKNPHVGARGRILDPREENTEPRADGDRPNASWVRLAMGLDRARDRASAQNWKLPVVPQLPRFYAGFAGMDAIDTEVSEAMIRDIATHTEQPVATVAAMAQDELLLLAKTRWPELWKAPQSEGNPTNLWLIETCYTTQLAQATQLYEDFSKMVGVDCWNPARDIKSIQFDNPARACAKTAGFDLDAAFAALAKSDAADEQVVDASYSADHLDNQEAEFDDAGDPRKCAADVPTTCESLYDTAVEQLLGLRDSVQAYLGVYAELLQLVDIDDIICNPDKPVTITVSPEFLAETAPVDDVVRLARQQLTKTRPLVSAGTTDEDLAQAVRNFNGPLHASRMSQFQVLKWDTQLSAEDAFTFTPADFGRARVFSKMHAANRWSPASYVTQPVEQLAEPVAAVEEGTLQHATAE